jgi:drug/metabolite transporter (DMT)-like permease
MDSILPKSAYLRASIAMVFAMAAFVTNDTLVKHLAVALPVGELVAIRGAFATLFILTICLRQGMLAHAPAIASPTVFMRAGLDLIGTLAFITALKHMPIANLTAILQAVPLAVTALGVFLLGERVGWRRTFSIAAGFAGVLLIVQPDPATFTIYESFAVGIVFMLAARDIITRRIPAHVPSPIVALANAGFVTAGGLLLSFVQEFQTPDAVQILALAAAAVFLAAGYLFMVLTLRLADISQTAPFRYSIILFAILSGILVFGEWPDRWALAGIALIVAAGLYALRREAKLAQAAHAT